LAIFLPTRVAPNWEITQIISAEVRGFSAEPTPTTEFTSKWQGVFVFFAWFEDDEEELPMLKGFREFILRGNVIDLAVAVVIGAAFGAVITAFVADVLNPLIAAMIGKPDFAAMVANVNGSEVKYGLFLNALISFLLIAGAVYFVMVAPMNVWKERQSRGQVPPDATTKICPACKESIVIAARKCKWCGEEQGDRNLPAAA
jgi:large conductance mechanosensitive channel